MFLVTSARNASLNAILSDDASTHGCMAEFLDVLNIQSSKEKTSLHMANVADPRRVLIPHNSMTKFKMESMLHILVKQHLAQQAGISPSHICYLSYIAYSMDSIFVKGLNYSQTTHDSSILFAESEELTRRSQPHLQSFPLLDTTQLLHTGVIELIFALFPPSTSED